MKIKSLLIKLFLVFWRQAPRNKKLWVFGSRFGHHYDENTKYLFEYVNRIAPDIRAIWLTENREIYKHLNEIGYEVYMTYSFYGYFYATFAGVTVVSVYLGDVNKAMVAGSKVIQLWHGTPLKTNDITLLGEDYDLVILASEVFLHEQDLGDKSKFKFVVTGYPKNDILISSQKREKAEQLQSDYHCDKIVLYLPTYRESAIRDGNEFDLFESFGFDLDILENLMKRHNALFILKLHPLDHFNDNDIVERIYRSKNLHVINHNDPLEDVYEYLGYIDVLITDYSSVYFDFLLKNRPIIFAPFDFDSYIARRPLRFSYNEITPGPKAKSWPELCTFLDEILSGKDDWSDLRCVINRRFNTYHDGSSSERVYNEIMSLLGMDSHE